VLCHDLKLYKFDGPVLLSPQAMSIDYIK
jgi:hypothetical protein